MPACNHVNTDVTWPDQGMNMSDYLFIRIHVCFCSNGTSDWSNHGHVMQTVIGTLMPSWMQWLGPKGCSCQVGQNGCVMLSSEGHTLKVAVCMNIPSQASAASA